MPIIIIISFFELQFKGSVAGYLRTPKLKGIASQIIVTTYYLSTYRISLGGNSINGPPHVMISREITS